MQRTIVNWWSCGLVVFIASGLGIWMPALFDWTGTQQSRIAPIVVQMGVVIPASLVTLAIGLLASYFWMKPNRSVSETPTTKPAIDRRRFKIWHLLVATFVCAALVVLTQKFGGLVVAISFYLIALAIYGWGLRNAMHRPGLVSFLLSAYCPFLWTLTEIKMLVFVLSSFAGLPCFIPALIISNLYLGGINDQSPWLPLAMTAVWIAAGTKIVAIGVRSAILVIAVTFALSSVGSFLLHSLVRM